MRHAAFYCVAEERFFLGAVGLVNSLRLLGHREPIFLLDCGLTAEQRRALEPEVTLVDGPEGASPHVLKAVAPRLHPAETMILIDVDMLATRSLAPLVEAASAGRVVAFENDRHRYFPEWSALTGLGPAQPGPYVSSGLVVLGGAAGARTLELFGEHLAVVDFERTFWRRNEPAYPFLFADQDVLNAVLRTAITPEELVALEQRLAITPPFAGLRLREAGALSCAFPDGAEPYVLHHFDRKPWLVPMRSSVYSRILTRVLLGEDVAVRLDPEDLPVRLRQGPAAAAVRLALDLGLAPRGAARRLRERRERASSGPAR